jgi:hypothetical protein
MRQLPGVLLGARAWFAAVALMALASNASAQADPSVPDWQHGTTLAGFVGVSSASSATDIAAGLSMGWEVTPRLGVEGRGIWLPAGEPEDAFAATVAIRAAVRPGHLVVPFGSAGLGVYRASFDANTTEVPDFYRTRMSPTGVGGQTFNDFTVLFGGGLDVFITRHLALRPEVNVVLTMTGRDSRAVAIYGAQVAYHFEAHTITPLVHGRSGR